MTNGQMTSQRSGSTCCPTTTPLSPRLRREFGSLILRARSSKPPAESGAILRPVGTLAVLAFAFGFPIAIHAEDAPRATISASTIHPPIQYRRIYVPADKMEAWPRDNEKLIPIEAHDFDKWIRSANDSAIGQTNLVTINSAEYSARLGSDGQLHGNGQWTIVLRGEQPAFVPLSDLSLILRDPHWHYSPQEPARIGTWGQSGDTPSRFGLEVARSGVLTFEWEIQTHATDDQTDIPWRVPAANSVRLTLDLPQGKQPRIDGGALLESNQRPPDDKSPDKPLRRWVLALSPSQAANLRIVSANRKTSESAAQTALHEDVSYHIGRRGLDITATWQLAGPADEKRELTVAVSPGLQLSSLKSDGRDLPWRLVRDSSLPTDTAIIELPKRHKDNVLQITVKAWQPLVVDAPWRLPRLRPEGLFWSSGTFELSVAAGYELKRLIPTDCIETGSSRLSTGEDDPETHSFTAYTPSAAVELNLSERQTDATIRAGSSLALADPNLNGRLVTQWSLSHGSTHQLVGTMAAGWIVEAVETIPADAMTEWFIDRHGDEQQIEIQLSRAASAARNVSVMVTARLQRFSLAEPISADTMRMVKWTGAKTAQHLLTFQSSERYTAALVGNLPEIAPDSINTNDRPLLDQAAENKLFDITDAAKNAGLQLTLRRGQFAAHIDVELVYENEFLRQEYRLTAEPTSGPIDRLLIYATGPLGNGVRWIEKVSNAPIAAEKLADNDPQRSQLPKEGEVWLLRFPQPTTRAIDISATVNTKRPERALVPLLFVPEATQQDARVALRCRHHNALWLEPSKLQTIPLPQIATTANEPNDPPPVCAAYRYQPTDCRDPATAPKLWASAISDGKTIPLTARHVQLESYVWPDGSGTHCATYQLDSHGGTELPLSMPAEVRLVSASLDGLPLDVAKPADSGRPAQLRLQPQTRATQLSLYLETRDPPLTAGRELSPPLVLGDLPFLAGDWNVWLPEEYAASGTGLSATTSEFNWRERLFGVLGRPAGSRPFNPFRLVDGATLINGLAEGNMAGSPTANPPNSIPSPTAGWRRYHEPFIAGGPAPIVVTHPPAITAWSVALLLTCFLSGRWIRQIRAEAFAVALSAAAGLALVLPFAYANLASGAVLGFLLSLIADWRLRSIFAEERARSPRRSSAVTVAIAVVFAIGLAKLSYAQSPQATIASHEAPTQLIYRLLIPVDAKGHPTGSKSYVSDQFLRALTTAASVSNPSAGQWLVSDATFTGELVEKPGQKDILAGNWTATFSVETLARDTTVVLPLVRSEADWNAAAMLDGVPLPLEWRDAGRKCAIEIPEPGRYTLALTCVPNTTAAGRTNQLDLAIPPISSAKTEVRFPESATGVTIDRANILQPPAGTSNTLSAVLDRTDRLHIRWSHSEKSEGSTPGFSLTEMRWLHIMPTEIEMTVKYLLEGGARRPDSLTATHDDRWKLLTNEEPVSAKNSSDNSTGQHVIRIPLATQNTDHQEIVLHFRLVDPPALGNFRLPPIELTSTPASKRWLAVSSDPTLDCEIPDSSATEGTVNEFFTKWGDAGANDPPQSVLSNFDAGRASTLSIRPRETESIVDESLNVAAGLAVLRVNYEAKIAPGSTGAYRAELSVPANLSISQIAVRESDRPIPLRWSLTAKNRVNVFFGQQMTKPYRLVLDGTTPVESSGKANLPHISALATEDATQKIRLYRDDDVHVELEGLPAATDPKAEQPGPPPSDWSARPVAICYLESDNPTARVVVTPNKCKFAGDLLTALTRENGAWWANYRCQLSVEAGDLDIVRLQIPSACTGPFDIQSAIPVTTEFKFLNDQTGSLSIRFATPIAKGGALDLRIRSPIKPSTGAAVSVPAIVLESLSGGHRYISVPESADSQVIAWTETGVRPATIPQKLRAASVATAPTQSFEVMSDPFQVISRPPAMPEVTPQIRLADTAIVAGELGTQRITTRLILAPHGLTDCTVQLPPNQTLVAIELDGRPAVHRQLDPSRWQVALNTPQLPQSLEIVSRSSAENGSTRISELQRASLLAHGKPIPAEMSLWSFAYPERSVTRLVEDADNVTAVEQAALRFDRLVSITEAAKTTAAELPHPDGYNWFQPWANLLTAVRAETQQMNTGPQLERVESQVSHTFDDQITQAAARLDKWINDCRKTLVGPNPEKTAAPIQVDEPLALPQPTAPAADEWTYYVAEGGDDRLAIQLQPLDLTASQVRVIGLLLIVGGLIAAIWLLRRPVTADLLYRWPHTFGVLAGIAYWAWLWPSWLGILISAVSLWLALRFNWPGRSLRTEASTVLRASQSA
jgi:hypothetical protein